MLCDRPGCPTRSRIEPDEKHLPLTEFADDGWYIARVHGDLCPTCVTAEGGMHDLVWKRRRNPLSPSGDASPSGPHNLMEQDDLR